MWLASAGLPASLAEKGQIFDDFNILMETAVAGQGVALGTRPLVDGDLRTKRLVMAVNAEIPSQERYCVGYRQRALEEPAIKAFHDWLLEEVQRPCRADERKIGHGLPVSRLRR
jgi:LysR family glycine cleavage system transcriptional activator